MMRAHSHTESFRSETSDRIKVDCFVFDCVGGRKVMSIKLFESFLLPSATRQSPLGTGGQLENLSPARFREIHGFASLPRDRFAFIVCNSN